MILADVAEQLGKLPEMLEHLAAASLTIERDRDQNRHLESVALHERRGKALLAMNDAAGALVEANLALRLGEELARHSDDADGRRDFAILRHDIASIYRDTGRYSDAVHQFAAACADFETLLGVNRENVELRRLLAQCLGDAGEAHLLAEDSQAALKQMLRSLALQQELADLAAGQPAWQLELATCHRQLGDWYAKRGAHATALEKYRYARQVLEGPAAKLESYRKLQEELASIDAKIGSVQRAARDPAAIASYQAALDRYRHLAAHDPSNARWQKGLAETTDALETLRKSGERDRASQAIKS
jgi:tetratricopeptide (TPR) repeat protein